MKLAFGSLVSNTFITKLLGICSWLRIDVPSWLMACMDFESAGTFDPAKVNPSTGATGLIQFMPHTAQDLGTTTEALAKMTAEQQLDYVGRYLKPYAGKMHSMSDVYMAILWPKAVGEPEDYIVFASGQDAYAKNRGLDFNHDNAVTKAEAASFVAKRLDEGMQAPYVVDLDATAAEEQPAPAPAVVEQEQQQSTSSTQEVPMGALALPLLQTILPAVIGLFSQKAQTQISKVTGASPDAAAAFLQNLMGQVSNVTNIPVTDATSAIQAVAAVTQPDKAAAIADLEQHCLDYLDKLSPMIDKLAEVESANKAQSIVAMDAAAKRAQGEKWDMTPWLVWMSGGAATIVVLTLLAAITYQAVMKDSINVGLIGLAGPIIMGAIRVWQEIFAYRFDGSKQSEAQTALVGTIVDASKRGSSIGV